MLKAGQVYLGKYPPGTGKDRRFFILTDEVNGEATVVWVFTSTQISDETVILQPGDHPAISETCSVVYSVSQIINANNFRIAERKGALTQEVDLDPTLLAKIQEGIFESEETPLSVIDYCKDRI